ncbi:four-carbon acid sugar kinase family protein [Bradyrhizobium sp. SYSU BS000235]|uniref:four-carbon acid sugar kinase family protein n=1 Tax=Bradyrhizobium sp. SYSU BS000235 TaxID=3411332 RepID=UPI003C74E440
MALLRLLADDLTGALDTGVEFVGLCGPLEVCWTQSLPSTLSESLILDSGTRELGKAQVVPIIERLVPALYDATIAFKKVDSLMRGEWAAELAACLRPGRWSSCIVAPAFVYQGRRTRGGQQFARTQDGSWSPVGGNILALLAAEGIDAHQGQLEKELPPGVSVFNAESEDDLDRVVAVGRSAQGSVLWVGSGGLARALARGHEVSVSPRLQAPVLGLFGSDQPATAAQLAACGSQVVTLTEGAPDHARDVERRLAADGVVLARFGLPSGLSRTDAAQRIARELAAMTLQLQPPGTLIVAGGETLRALCVAIGAQSLKLAGQIMPGLPRSVIQGGRWSDVEVISKSGSLGPANLWADLLRDNHLVPDRIGT